MFGDVRRAVERRHPCESDAGAASGIEIGVFFQRDVVPNEIDDLFGDGQRGRQTGGLDSQKVNQAGSGPVDYELAPLFDRAKSGELADDLPGRNRGNKFLCRSENPRQGFVGGREIVLSVGELGRRTDQIVPVGRRRDKNPFSLLGRDGKDRVADEFGIEMVENEIFPFARTDFVVGGSAPLGERGVGERVGVKSGGVDQRASTVSAPACRHGIPPVGGGRDAGDLFVETKRHAVLDRVFGERDGQFERIDDPRGRREKGGANFWSEVRLAPEDFGTAQNFDRNAVLRGSGGEFVEDGDLFVADRQCQRTDHFQIDVELPAGLGEETVSGDVHFRFQASGDRIVAGVDDRRVCRRRDRANVAFAIQKEEAEPVPRQGAGDRGADDAGADDHSVERF